VLSERTQQLGHEIRRMSAQDHPTMSFVKPWLRWGANVDISTQVVVTLREGWHP
jgi:hypothetical protein